MNKKTLAALKASIQHWRENEAAETPDGASVWGDNCALCSIFAENDDCAGCPVQKKTGSGQCWESPWYGAKTAFLLWNKNPDNTGARAAFRTAARAEREFLESLLPEGER